MPWAKLYVGDARELPLPDESVHAVVTSPPYWGLRDYGLQPLTWDASEGCKHDWAMTSRPGTKLGSGGNTNGTYAGERIDPGKAYANSPMPLPSGSCALCGAWRGSLGLEPTPELYVRHVVQVFREIRRVLRSEGTVWLNLGDSYAGSGSPGGDFRDGRGGDTYLRPYNRMGIGLKPKDLAGIPWRVALALQTDGWWLRSDIIWHKLNPMPESVRDRPTRSHEHLFLLAKSGRYFYDADAIREPQSGNAHARRKDGIREHTTGKTNPALRGTHAGWKDTYVQIPGGRNKRSVWTIRGEPFPGAHFATFPTGLVEPCILAGTSDQGVCPKCGAPWYRVVHNSGTGPQRNHRKNSQIRLTRLAGQAWQQWKAMHPNSDLGWQPSCTCDVGNPVPAVVLDPFMGSGTVGVVAAKLGRNFVGVDLKPEYVEMAVKRVQQDSKVEIILEGNQPLAII